MDQNIICLGVAALVYCVAFGLAMRHAERSIPAAEREKERKGYFSKRDAPAADPLPTKLPAPPTLPTEYNYDSTAVMPNPPSDPPSSSGSDPPPSA